MSGGILVHTSVSAVAKGAARSTTDKVEEGCVIKAIHLEYWLNGNGSNQTTQFVLIAYKLPSGLTEPTVSDMLNLQAWPNKKNILFSSQGNLAEGGNSSIPVLRDWIKIPKGKQRFGLEDKFQVAVATVDADLQECGMVTYKEYD